MKNKLKTNSKQTSLFKFLYTLSAGAFFVVVITALSMALYSCGTDCCAPPFYYRLALFVKTSDARANNLPADTIGRMDKRVYFYRLNKEYEDTVKIPTEYSYYSMNFGGEPYVTIYSASKNIYDSIAGKGLVTVYLHKLHGAVDTLQIDVVKNTKDKRRRGASYTMNQIMINHHKPVVFEEYGGDGYGYYLTRYTTGTGQ